MINPSNDRLNYGNILTPPHNYKLDFAISATYSLDLNSLIGASISLGLNDDTDSDLMESEIYLLDALRKTSDKVALFCEAGQIQKPVKVTPFYILLEKMVYPVKTTKNINITKYPSFHPKFWLLRFVNENNEFLYRTIVLSRNLTFNRNWDVSFVMDGVESSKTSKNNPLINFLNYLSLHIKDYNKKEKIKEIMDSLHYVEFKLNSDEFKDFEFVVNGIDDESDIKNQPLFKENFDEVLIMSPFLSSNIIKDFNERSSKNAKLMLFTHSSSLSKLKSEDCDKFDIYTLKDEVVDGESIISENAQDFQKQDIHAKLYMTRKGNDVDLYLGSLNASHNAVYGNVEFMIRLKTTKKYLNINKLSRDLFNGSYEDSECPFKLVDINSYCDEAESDENDLNSIIKEIIRKNPKAKIIHHNEKYNIQVFTNAFNENIQISPLLVPEKKEKLTQKVCFKNLTKLQLCEFFTVSVKENDHEISRVIKIPCEDMPSDRENSLICDIINDEDSFIKYISFLLGDDFILSALGIEKAGKDNFDFSTYAQSTALYEKMLKAAYYQPEKFKDLEFIIKAVSDDGVIPEGFEGLYKTFKEVVYNG